MQVFFYGESVMFFYWVIIKKMTGIGGGNGQDPPTDINLFSAMMETLVGGAAKLFEASGNLIAGIAPIFSVGFGIYMLLLCFYYYNRGIDESIVDLSKKIAAWLIIIALGFNAGNYGKVANIAYNAPDALSTMVTGQEYSGSSLDQIYSETLQTTRQIEKTAKELEVTNISDRLTLAIGQIMIESLSVIYLGWVLIFYILTKISLAMVLMVGPLFIGFLLFPATRQWGMNWIGQIMNYLITITFYVVIGQIQQNFFTTNLLNALHNGVHTVVQVLFLIPLFLFSTVLFMIIVWNVPSIANALFAGASIQGFGRAFVSIAKGIAGKNPNLSNGSSKTTNIVKKG